MKKPNSPDFPTPPSPRTTIFTSCSLIPLLLPFVALILCSITKSNNKHGQLYPFHSRSNHIMVCLEQDFLLFFSKYFCAFQPMFTISYDLSTATIGWFLWSICREELTDWLRGKGPCCHLVINDNSNVGE